MSGDLAQALGVPCPTCYAPAGARCCVQQGGIVSYWYGARDFHAARVRAAEAAERAEKALANFERFVFVGWPGHPDKPYHDAGVSLATALRALLAAGPEAKAPREYGPCPNYREGQSHAGCNLCGGLGTLPILSDADIAPPPPSDAVREAAEVVRTILTAHDARLSESGVLTYGPPSKGTGFVAAIQWLRRYDAARGGE